MTPKSDQLGMSAGRSGLEVDFGMHSVKPTADNIQWDAMEPAQKSVKKEPIAHEKPPAETSRSSNKAVSETYYEPNDREARCHSTYNDLHLFLPSYS